ncbi:MAG TPA: prepilin-type N-terminal cleavage/methylation domain-containing protein [Candidatus Sulfotelmatobacter sp.]|nr:prepilin-type N-terminal cleavage/methylation domain-containing protein [Candidatus Sulfotelmatobacter sp.]
MKMQRQNSRLGFTLLELMVSMALGLIVMAAMASLFKTGLNSAMIVTQRAETQQNMRAAIDLMVKDISLAGAGLPTGGIQLPTGTGSTASKYACDQAGTCHVPVYTYPTGNFMYGIIPGYQNGVEANAAIAAAPAPRFSDSITVVYTDYNFPIWEYWACFPTGANGGSLNVYANTAYSPAPPAINSAGGIQAGDLIMVSGGGLTAVGEVTTTPTSTGMTFANLDALNMNQSGATSGNLKAIQSAVGSCTAATPTAGTNSVGLYRLYAVTYYINVPAGATTVPPTQTPRLMRQVNGLTPVPVADDIINLQFAFDSDNAGALDANQPNPLGVGESPNNFQKVNIIVMGQSIIQNSRSSQNMYLATSVSARNMTFRNRYQ